MCVYCLQVMPFSTFATVQECLNKFQELCPTRNSTSDDLSRRLACADNYENTDAAIVAMGPQMIRECELETPQAAADEVAIDSLTQVTQRRKRLSELHATLDKIETVLRSLKEHESVEMSAINELVELGQGYNGALMELGAGIAMKVGVLTFVLHGPVSFPIFILATGTAALTEHILKKVVRSFMRMTSEQKLDSYEHDESSTFFMRTSMLAVSCMTNFHSTWSLLQQTIQQMITGEIAVKLLYDLIRFAVVLWHKAGLGTAVRLSRAAAEKHMSALNATESELLEYRATVQRMIDEIEASQRSEDQEMAGLMDEYQPPPPGGAALPPSASGREGDAVAAARVPASTTATHAGASEVKTSRL